MAYGAWYNTCMKLKNPFLTAGYAGADYFCDRVDETKKLIAAIENDRNVTLIAPRRYGKTGLISNVFASLPPEYASVYIDIYSIKNLEAKKRSLYRLVSLNHDDRMVRNQIKASKQHLVKSADVCFYLVSELFINHLACSHVSEILLLFIRDMFQ